MTKQVHVVIDGVVYCAHQKRPIELEACFACPNLRELKLDAAPPRVICDVAEDAGK